MLIKNRVITFLCSLGLTGYITISALAAPKKTTLSSNFIVENAPIILGENTFHPFTGIVKGKNVRIRTAPRLDSSVLKEVSSGELLPIIGETENFYCIRSLPEIKGYIFRSFVVNGMIEGDQVNVRAAPSTLSPILHKLHRGDYVTAHEEQEKWLEIDLPDACLFYISKEFIEKKGDILLFNEMNDKCKTAHELLNKAVIFAENELKKPLSHINLEEIYRNINQIGENCCKDFPEMQSKIDRELEKIQQIFLKKKSEEQQPTVNTFYEKSKLSKHLRRIDPIKTTPTLKNYEEIEESLYKLWLSGLPVNSKASSIEDFYKQESKKHKTLSGKLELYPYVIKNAPGQFLLKNNSRTVAFLYSTKIDLNEFLDKEIEITALPRSNNYFAFLAFFVTSIKTIATEN